MKKLLIVLALILGSTLTATPAQEAFAGGRQHHCFYHSKTYYLGIQSIAHNRLARVDLHAKACEHRDKHGVWRASDHKSYVHTNLVVNNWSKLNGVRWHLEQPYLTKSISLETTTYIRGSFKLCASYYVPICLTQGDFFIQVTFNDTALTCCVIGYQHWYWHVYQGEPCCNPGRIDRLLAVYHHA